ncbi:hypothetical protein HanXRQr2_Chr11g0520191 [Helianthus annuus]|uniref:Uncharacterized protein n=1 Tax=Helianthus annuus TaxID=4232 RepID=A0A9K3HU20_HELAN|nr:hypothetical protein HanXRQr2_Chr11g0520191 [Helianthus annuus]
MTDSNFTWNHNHHYTSSPTLLPAILSLNHLRSSSSSLAETRHQTSSSSSLAVIIIVFGVRHHHLHNLRPHNTYPIEPPPPPSINLQHTDHRSTFLLHQPWFTANHRRPPTNLFTSGHQQQPPCHSSLFIIICVRCVLRKRKLI